mmetsp:Transcript_20586/g.56528  ORF Transcript_20586/g.56528 Transcript_20586/m.56528 type:complete len:118 (+) Transcript_20586:208-561(+)
MKVIEDAHGGPGLVNVNTLPGRIFKASLLAQAVTSLAAWLAHRTSLCRRTCRPSLEMKPYPHPDRVLRPPGERPWQQRPAMQAKASMSTRHVSDGLTIALLLPPGQNELMLSLSVDK